MKKISIKEIQKELELIGASDGKSTIIINNCELYNDMLAAYKAEKNQHDIYLLIQLNSMIMKQLNELQKLNKKVDSPKDLKFLSEYNDSINDES